MRYLEVVSELEDKYGAPHQSGSFKPITCPTPHPMRTAVWGETRGHGPGLDVYERPRYDTSGDALPVHIDVYGRIRNRESPRFIILDGDFAVEGVSVDRVVQSSEELARLMNSDESIMYPLFLELSVLEPELKNLMQTIGK